MVSIEQVLYIIPVLALAASILYYAMVIQNQNKTRQLQLQAQQQATETRQTQLFMQIFQEINTDESWRSTLELILCKYTDYDDFMQKYDSSVNPENWFKRMRIWNSYNAIGYLVLDGSISVEKVARLIGYHVIGMWNVWGNAIIWMRAKQGYTNWYNGFEYLYNELAKYYKEHPELTLVNPEINPRYVPKY